MGAREFYKTIGQDYSSVIQRMMGSEDLLFMLLKEFQKDKTFDLLKKAVFVGEAKEIFTQSHTLKGLALNLGLKPLAEATGVLVELTRKKNGPVTDEAKAAFEKIEAAYELVLSLLQAVTAEEEAFDEK